MVEAFYIRSLDVVIGSVGLFIGFYSLFVNILILIVMVRLKRRSCSDTVFCHLAATDIMASLDAIFAFGLLLSDRTFFDFYFIDDIICQFTGITWCVVSVATPLLLSIVSIGRFLALYAPHRYDLIYTPNLVQILIVISWTISVVGGTMHVWKLENMQMRREWAYCDYRLVDIYTPNQVRYIVVFLYSIPLSLSTIILLFCNVAVAIRLTRLRLKRPIVAVLKSVSIKSQRPHSHCTQTCNSVVFSNAANDLADCNLGECTTGEASSGSDNNIVEIKSPESGKLATNRVSPSTTTVLNTAVPIVKTKSKKSRRNKKEKQVIIATLLFSLNFGSCYFVMLYYYFSYMIKPTYSVFNALSGGDVIKETYILGWFYYATFLSSSINPIIHFSCNSKIRNGVVNLFNAVKGKFIKL